MPFTVFSGIFCHSSGDGTVNGLSYRQYSSLSQATWSFQSSGDMFDSDDGLAGYIVLSSFHFSISQIDETALGV